MMTNSDGVSRLNRIPYPLFLSASAAVAFVVIICFFCPRFVRWQGLEVPPSYGNPEVNRAVVTLWKIAYPFEASTDEPVTWRALFPVISHFLRLPRTVFFALPHLGCLLLLAYITHLTCQHTGNRLRAWLTATLLGTTSWFFVSTGWLAYFDSWYVLGLVVVVFALSRWAVAAACLLAPWVDERFVLALPLCVIVRAIHLRSFHDQSWQALRRDAAVVAGTVGPYILLRLYLLLGGRDEDTADHLRTFHYLTDLDPWQTVESLWSGLRAGWLFVAAFLWWAAPPGRRWGAAALGAAVVITMAAIMQVGGDFSRNTSILIPTAMLGVLLLHRARQPRLGVIISVALVFNLLAPAVHGFNRWRIPIKNLYTEIQNYRNPPLSVNPAHYTKLALSLWQQGDPTNAVMNLTFAIRLDPRYPAAWYNRGLLRQQLDDPQGAIADLTRALEVAPPAWPDRATAEKHLDSLRRGP